MALLFNNFNSAASVNAYRYVGNPRPFRYTPVWGARLNPAVGRVARSASFPDGYGMGAATPPIKAGAMSSWQRTSATVDGTATQVNGATLAGTSTLTWSADNRSLSMQILMDGTAALTFTVGDATLLMALDVEGSGTFSISGEGNVLSVTLPFEGLGTFSMTGEADLRGNLSMAGEWTPFTELSPGALADAVWSHNTTDHMDEGTAGYKLNAAGSASNPWTDPVGIAVSEQVEELHRIKGLNAAVPVATTEPSETVTVLTAGDITLTIDDSSGITRT